MVILAALLAGCNLPWTAPAAAPTHPAASTQTAPAAAATQPGSAYPSVYPGSYPGSEQNTPPTQAEIAYPAGGEAPHYPGGENLAYPTPPADPYPGSPGLPVETPPTPTASLSAASATPSVTAAPAALPEKTQAASKTPPRTAPAQTLRPPTATHTPAATTPVQVTPGAAELTATPSLVSATPALTDTTTTPTSEILPPTETQGGYPAPPVNDTGAYPGVIASPGPYPGAEATIAPEGGVEPTLTEQPGRPSGEATPYREPGKTPLPTLDPAEEPAEPAEAPAGPPPSAPGGLQYMQNGSGVTLTPAVLPPAANGLVLGALNMNGVQAAAQFDRLQAAFGLQSSGATPTPGVLLAGLPLAQDTPAPPQPSGQEGAATATPTATSTPRPSETPTQPPPTATPYQTPTPTPSLTPTITNTPLPAPPWTYARLPAADPRSVQRSAGKPQLIVFFAYWSGPSQSMTPLLLGLESEYDGKVIFTYLDIDNPATLALQRSLGFRQEPHLFLLDAQGQVLQQWSGSVSLEQLRQALNEASQP